MHLYYTHSHKYIIVVAYKILQLLSAWCLYNIIGVLLVLTSLADLSARTHYIHDLVYTLLQY